MRDWFVEWLYVFSVSTRAQACVCVGILLALIALIAGRFIAADFELGGVYAPMTTVLREYVLDRYNAVALGILIAALSGAVRCLRKDRDRLLEN
ncbi:MAG: hypothetical protein AAFV47_07665 [Pseudomonadota bacterium]